MAFESHATGLTESDSGAMDWATDLADMGRESSITWAFTSLTSAIERPPGYNPPEVARDPPGTVDL